MTNKKEEEAKNVGLCGLMSFVSSTSHEMAITVMKSRTAEEYLDPEIISEINQLHDIQKKLTWMLARLSDHAHKTDEYRR